MSGNFAIESPETRRRIFRSIIDSTPAAIYVKDRDGLITVAFPDEPQHG